MKRVEIIQFKIKYNYICDKTQKNLSELSIIHADEIYICFPTNYKTHFHNLITGV